MALRVPAAGVIEYWSAGEGYGFPGEEVDFRFKLDTDLYALAKAKAVAHSLEVSRDGSKFVTMSSDRWVWVCLCLRGWRGRLQGREGLGRAARAGSGSGAVAPPVPGLLAQLAVHVCSLWCGAGATPSEPDARQPPLPARAGRCGCSGLLVASCRGHTMSRWKR